MEQKPAAGSPEALLEAEGDWALVEDKKAADPEKQHMDSRKQVNPSQTQGHNAYTEKVSDSGANDDVHFRVLRLERQMENLQGDVDKLLPPLGAKAKADRDLNTAVEEIQSARMGEIKPYPMKEAPPTAKAEAKPVPAPKKAEAPVKPAVGGALQVTGVRVGDHPGKTRLVLDLTGPSKFTADLDSAENLLVVELPGAAWSAAATKSFGGHALLKSYSTQKSGDGTRLVFELKKSSKLTMKSSLPPNSTYGHYRVVMDLSAN